MKNGAIQSLDYGYQGGRQGDSIAWMISFYSKLTADAVAKIYVVTEKSVVTVPFELKNIALP